MSQDLALAKAVKQARKLEGLTQPEAVALADVGITTWSLTERGTPPATPEKLAAMARVVHLSASTLRGLGYSDAAELVEAAAQAPQTANILDTVTAAQELLLTAGWSVTIRPFGDGFELTVLP